LEKAIIRVKGKLKKIVTKTSIYLSIKLSFNLFFIKYRTFQFVGTLYTYGQDCIEPTSNGKA